MQKHNTAQSAKKVPLHEIPIIEALFRIEYWNEKLMDIRAERRQIIESKGLSDEWRKKALEINSGLRQAIRARLNECQHDHVRAVHESAMRMAEGACNAITLPCPTLSANDGHYRANTDGGVE